MYGFVMTGDAVDVSRVDLRVGLITTTVRHPEAEKLYLETGSAVFCVEKEA